MKRKMVTATIKPWSQMICDLLTWTVIKNSPANEMRRTKFTYKKKTKYGLP